MKKSQFLIWLLLLSGIAVAQPNRLNIGLTEKQSAATLPKSAVAIKFPVRLAKVTPSSDLRDLTNGEYLIANGWELIEAAKAPDNFNKIFSTAYATDHWYDAVVPGTVLTTLVQQGIYPDPYFGINNLAIPDSLCHINWLYRTIFNMPAKEKSKSAILEFNGINYKAVIWLNGKKLGTINGAFSRGIFDVTNVMMPGRNVLAVQIMPPPNPGISHEESPTAGTGPNGGQLCKDGPTFIASEGWDWIPGIKDRNIGIWQDVKLRFVNAVSIDDAYITTDLPLPDTSFAWLTVKATLHNHTNLKQTITIAGKTQAIQFSASYLLKPNEVKEVTFDPAKYKQLKFNHPKLWWPNGYGSPALYQLSLDLKQANGQTCDKRILRFGVREISYDLTADAPNKLNSRINYDPTDVIKNGKPIFDNMYNRKAGDDVYIPRIKDSVASGLLTAIADDGTSPYLAIRVNGKRIYIKGGNWGMDDAMKRSDKAHLEPYIRLHQEANFNMLRNWTGESTEDALYELCDEYGILVWNEFWMSTAGYNLYPNDNRLFLVNAKETIIRFRHHPSIVLWCARNEGRPEEIIENGLSELVAKYDGTRLYQSSSIFMNLPNSGPWNFFKDPVNYYKLNPVGFKTELGTVSIPTAGSIRRMMAGEDTWPISDVWYYHDLHDGQKEFRNTLDSLYGKATDLDDFCRKAQMINYDSHRAMFESYSNKLWNSTTGLLLWMTHPAWPSMVWQVYSSDYETYGAYFASKKACEPVHIQMSLDSSLIAVVNTSLANFTDAQATAQLFSLEGKELYVQYRSLAVLANQRTAVFQLEKVKKLPDVYLTRLTLRNKSGALLSQNDYLQKSPVTANFLALNKLPNVKIISHITDQNLGKVSFVLENTSSIVALGIKLNITDEQHQIILPAYFSEGYFNLLPGEKKSLTVKFPENYQHLNIIAEGYNLPAGSCNQIRLSALKTIGGLGN